MLKMVISDSVGFCFVMTIVPNLADLASTGDALKGVSLKCVMTSETISFRRRLMSDLTLASKVDAF